MPTLFERQFGASEALRFLDEGGRAGLYCRDVASRTLKWSSGMYALMGVPREKTVLTYEFSNSLIPPDDRRPAIDYEESPKGVPIERRFRVLLPTGDLRAIASYSEFLLDAAGQPLKLIGFAIDIGERRKPKSATVTDSDPFVRFLKDCVLVVASWSIRPRCTARMLQETAIGVSSSLGIRSIQ